MIIIGVDIGLAKLGICSISVSDKPFKKLDIKQMTTFRLNGKIEKQNRLPTFLLEYTETIARIIREADLIIIEKPFGLRGYATVLFELFGIIKFIGIINEIKFNLPFLKKQKISFALKLPPFFLRLKKIKEHYWERGYQGFSKKIIRKVVSKYFRIVKEFNSHFNHYHYFFVLEKPY